MNQNEIDVAKDEDEDFRNFILTKFSHFEEVNKMIDNLDTIIGNQNSEEKWEDRMQYIFNLYQDQPHLLDPYLEILLQKCIKIIGKPHKIERKEGFVFRFIYLMTKTRGYKTVIKLMPHEVSDLEPVLNMLSNINPDNNEDWQARYVLILWLSIVTIIPFDMNLFDTPDKIPMTIRILDTGKKFLHSKDVSQIAAAFMLSKFVCRPDSIKQGILNQTIHWALENIKTVDLDNLVGHNFMCGLLRFFTYLFKFGKREDILPYSTLVLETNKSIDTIKWDREILLCRLRTKLVQRIGLIFLKMRVISWRYQRGNRTLLHTLNNKECLNSVSAKDLEANDSDDEDVEISEHLDEVIDFLINSLKNYFTIVRWSAAKGIGRICSRLPKRLADDVVEAILVLFSRLEGFSSWHGGCLALAELGRRGLLLPQRLPEVLPLILKALVYDEKSGECSYGANVRDAACYVCWSFARAYHPEELKPYVVDVASALIMVTLFDREVNVRRAASAAFQENVGRQGQFPHGIDILTNCDYFAVGNLTNCYLTLSMFIASYEEYIIHMIDHLITHKVGHWDYDIREMTSKALNKLYSFAPQYLMDNVLPGLMVSCTGLDLYRRQGAIMCIAELMRAIGDINQVPESIHNSILNLNDVLDTKMQFRGLSGELMRRAVCHLIRCCAEAGMKLDARPEMIDKWYKFLTECTAHKEKLVRNAAIEAFPVFLQFYSVDSAKEINDSFIIMYLNDIINQIENTSTEYIQISNLIILGKSPRPLLMHRIKDEESNEEFYVYVKSIEVLLSASKCDIPKSNKWGEARSFAVAAIVDICESVGVNHESITTKLIVQIYSTLLHSLDDYTFDSHGDIGALLRESAMSSILRLTSLLVHDLIDVFDEELTTEIMARIAQQAMEKIDRVRRKAGSVFYQLVHLTPTLPFIPHHEKLMKIFDKDLCDSLYWAAPHLTFPLFCQLLDFDEYRYRCVLGIVVSVGGITERTVQHSREALNRVIQSHDSDSKYLENLAKSFLHVFRDFLGQDRVTTPLLKTLECILSHPDYSDWFLSNIQSDSEGDDAGDNPLSSSSMLLVEMIERTREELGLNGGCRDVQKIKCAIELFCQMLQFPPFIRNKALPKLMILLGHRFPIIRKHTASYLYQALLTYDNLMNEDKLEELMNILQDTEWDKDMKEVREIRNAICDLFELSRPGKVQT